MLSRLYSAATLGTEGYEVEVEVDVSGGLPGISVVGLPDEAIKESRERVKSAIKNCGYEYPLGKITINLAPADIKKEGSCFDLAIALGLLASSGQIPGGIFGDCVFLGELSLDGRIRPVKGVLAAALYLRRLGGRKIILPVENAVEAAVVDGVEVYPAEGLREAIYLLTNLLERKPLKVPLQELIKPPSYEVDFSEVKGQRHTKRALEIAAAGFHNVLMVGPPGAGKTMLAKRLPTILPAMTLEEMLEVTTIYSVAGLLEKNKPLLLERPFRQVHHTSSDIALIGGGQNPRPGEVSLAHNGVLFLDELPEFHRDALESLRQPVEEGVVTVARANKTVTFLSKFLLVCAMNPCYCGNLGSHLRPCRCTTTQIQRYRNRISGPLLDRLDLYIDVPELRYEHLLTNREEESSAMIRSRVEAARQRQLERFKGTGIYFNSQMNQRLIRQYCLLDKDAEYLLKKAAQELALSARSYDRLLKVGRTIADLADSPIIKQEHLCEAVQYRMVERF